MSTPTFSIQAAVSDKTIDNETIAHRFAVLVLHGPKTTDAPKVIGKAVRAQFPRASDCLVANIVNLESMGGMWQKLADAQIKSTYEKLAAKLGDDADEYVVICKDYDNEIGPLFGVPDSNSDAQVAVLKDGDLLGVVAAQADAVLALMQ